MDELTVSVAVVLEEVVVPLDQVEQVAPAEEAVALAETVEVPLCLIKEPVMAVQALTVDPEPHLQLEAA